MVRREGAHGWGPQAGGGEAPRDGKEGGRSRSSAGSDCSHVASWCGVPSHVASWCGAAWRGVAWRGVAGRVMRGVACCGVLWRGVAWCGVVWRGVARCGAAWRAVAWWWLLPPRAPIRRMRERGRDQPWGHRACSSAWHGLAPSRARRGLPCRRCRWACAAARATHAARSARRRPDVREDAPAWGASAGVGSHGVCVGSHGRCAVGSHGARQRAPTGCAWGPTVAVQWGPTGCAPWGPMGCAWGPTVAMRRAVRLTSHLVENRRREWRRAWAPTGCACGVAGRWWAVRLDRMVDIAPCRRRQREWQRPSSRQRGPGAGGHAQTRRV
jgi:hypothetical protein